MSQELKVLDHGYVRLVEHWGSDERVIEAARMSTDKGFVGWGTDLMYTCPVHGLLEGDYRKGDVSYPHVYCMHCFGTVEGAKGLIPTTRGVGDEKLLKYLYDHKHATPFEFAGMVIEVQAPIFVIREWQRHRTQWATPDDFLDQVVYNEMSARYTPLPDLNYVPSRERVIEGARPAKNRQASGTQPLLVEAITDWEQAVQAAYVALENTYQVGLELGIPKELARIVLPVGRYSRMRASTNLRCWLMFLTLRMDEHAQWEIRQYANAVGSLIEQLFPRTWELFEAGR